MPAKEIRETWLFRNKKTIQWGHMLLRRCIIPLCIVIFVALTSEKLPPSWRSLLGTKVHPTTRAAQIFYCPPLPPPSWRHCLNCPSLLNQEVQKYPNFVPSKILLWHPLGKFQMMACLATLNQVPVLCEWRKHKSSIVQEFYCAVQYSRNFCFLLYKYLRQYFRTCLEPMNPTPLPSTP